MTLNRNLFRTAKLAGVAVALSAGSLTVAAAGPSYYTATLAAPADETRAVAGGVAWACEGSTCVAGKASARPLRICRGVNRKFGEVAAFTVKGTPLSADELAKCNA